MTPDEVVEKDPIKKCELCGTEVYVRGGQERGNTNWYEPTPKRPVSVERIMTIIHDLDDYKSERELAEKILAEINEGESK
jgi:hypothetical protein